MIIIKYFKIFIFILFVVLSTNSVYAVDNNSGLIDTSIWYAPSVFTEGDTIQIHTAVWNGEDYAINAKVEFLDVNTILGSRDITVPKGTLSDVYVSWKVTAGDHKISARIASASSSANGASFVAIVNKEESAKDFFIPKKLVVKKDGTTEVIPTVTDKVNEVLPPSVAAPINKTANSVDNFRQEVSSSLSDLKTEANTKIESFKNPAKVETKSNTNTKTTKTSEVNKTDQKLGTKDSTNNPVSGIDKPITYVELFLLTIALFIFKNSIVFYVILAVIIFLILRFIYRKIRR
jgi:hypothetical protein